MSKVKFQIKGMHCNSCATLIEERLKEQPGVSAAKVSFDSQKAAVVYDETKINEADMGQVIEKTGDYRVEKIEEKVEKSGDLLEKNPPETRAGSFLTGAITIVALTSIGLNIFFATSLNKSLKVLAAGGNTAVKQENTQQVAEQNNQAQGTNNAAIQSFNITNADHVLGNFNAPITLVEFSDFECPFCERNFPTLSRVLSDYGDKVRLVYKHFPLPFHPNSEKAAEASECASEQGKFWEYHDKLFENQSSGFSIDKFKQWAKDLNLNATQFNGCLDSGKYAQKVQTDLQEGQQKGVSGTPTTFINGQPVIGAQPYEAFKQTIDNL